jgi:hypothetical protein
LPDLPGQLPDKLFPTKGKINRATTFKQARVKHNILTLIGLSRCVLGKYHFLPSLDPAQSKGEASAAPFPNPEIQTLNKSRQNARTEVQNDKATANKKLKWKKQRCERKYKHFRILHFELSF